AVCVAAPETAAVTRAQQRVAMRRDQHYLAPARGHELVLGRMPMAPARPGARRQAQQVDPELGQAGGIAQAHALARGAGRIVGRRIAAARADRKLLDIDLLHAWIVGRDAGGDTAPVSAIIARQRAYSSMVRAKDS